MESIKAAGTFLWDVGASCASTMWENKVASAVSSPFVALGGYSAYYSIKSYNIGQTLKDLNINDYNIITKGTRVYNATIGKAAKAIGLSGTRPAAPIFDDATSREIDTVCQIIQQARASNQVSPPNIVIEGKPGVGKTVSAEDICNRCDISFICVPAGIMEKHLLAGSHVDAWLRIVKVAEQADGPCAIILNDGEELVAQRQNQADRNSAAPQAALPWQREEEDFKKVISQRRDALVNTILDMAGRQGNKICIIVTTNRPERIDTAMASRAKMLRIEPPKAEERKQILVSHLQRLFENDNALLGFFNHGRLEAMADAMEGFTGRNIVKTVENIRALVQMNKGNIRQDYIDVSIFNARSKDDAAAAHA